MDLALGATAIFFPHARGAKRLSLIIAAAGKYPPYYLIFTMCFAHECEQRGIRTHIQAWQIVNRHQNAEVSPNGPLAEQSSPKIGAGRRREIVDPVYTQGGRQIC
jgi:hypothetical protein